jgi:hypothetical protein
MGSLTDFAELELLDHIFENGAYSHVATVYMALLTSDAGEGGSVAGEPTGNGYARTAITFGSASARRVTQSGVVTFPQVTGSSWGTLTHWAIMDASESGAMLAYGTLQTSIVTVVGNVPFIPDTETYVEINAGAASNYLANTVLDFMFRNQDFDPPDCHVALCDSTIVDGDNGASISSYEPGGNYQRVNFNNWINAAAGALNNAAAIDFNTPDQDWPTITHGAILDAATNGNLLCYATATPNQAPKVGDPVSYPTGTYIITLN